MIFLILCGILVLGIAFFHYVQGFFSATLSAILTIIAGVLAFSWHEVIAEQVLKGKMANDAHALSLLVLFCLIYVILRVIFDKAIPRGLSMPAVADKVGAAVMGLIAAIFAVGLFAVAAQEMPFDAAPGGYARYAVGDRHAYIRRHQKGLDSSTTDELKSNEPGKFDEADRATVYVDDIFMNTTRFLSEQGSLSGDRKLTSVHPDFLQEMFGQRIGMQPGGIRVSNNFPGNQPAMEIASIYTLKSVKLDDLLPDKVRDTATHGKWTGELTANGTPSQPGGPKIDKGQMIVVVRMIFNRIAADRGDYLVRFSPGTCRLYAQQKDLSGNLQPVNYYPWGTVEKGNTVYLDKPDDYLFISLTEGEAKGVDLMYVVDKEGFLDPSSKPGAEKIADGVFIEYKRLDREDLSGKIVERAPKPTPGVPIGVIHPEIEVYTPPPPANYGDNRTAAPSQTPPPAPTRPATPPVNNAARGSFTSAQQNVAAIGGKVFNYQNMTMSNLLPTAVAVPQADVAKPFITVDATGVDGAHLKDKKFDTLTISPKVNVAQLGTGDFKTRELYVPPGQTMLLINSAQPSEPWVWAQKANAFKLLTSDNKRLAPHGVFAVIHDGSEDRLLAQYSVDNEQDVIAPPSAGTPKQVTLVFLLPEGVKPKELTVDDQTVKVLTDEPMQPAK